MEQDEAESSQQGCVSVGGCIDIKSSMRTGLGRMSICLSLLPVSLDDGQSFQICWHSCIIGLMNGTVEPCCRVARLEKRLWKADQHLFVFAFDFAQSSATASSMTRRIRLKI